jgi:hydrogenase expression/formation protein HypE
VDATLILRSVRPWFPAKVPVRHIFSTENLITTNNRAPREVIVPEDLQESLACPIEHHDANDRISLAHGEGGRLMRQLIRQRIAPLISSARDTSDAANLGRIDGEAVITTDSFVVSPLFFPGGNIGSLAVHGTVNDLAVSGARPRWLTLSLIVEDGLPLQTFDRIIDGIAKAAEQCGVQVVAGDTKVVPRGAADQIFINTSGVGEMHDSAPTGPSSICEDDVLIVSGPIGKHGIAVLAARENLRFEPPPESDSAPLHEATFALQQALKSNLRSMRDATRGGVSAVLHEWAEASAKTMKLNESQLPVTADVRGACELLGLDPLYVANEGTFVCAVAPGSEARAIEALHSVPQTRSACVIGSVMQRGIVPVAIEGLLGSLRPVDEPSGAPMPRIC